MKIQTITINKYKAFTKEERIPIGGSNVFIYGENGSGKSSFYYALKDFFQSSVENVPMAQLRNFNLTDGGTDCSIKIEFDGEIIKTLNETTKDTNTTEITDANRLKSFLTYKHLLGVHNVKVSDKIDVFELIVNGVLKHYKSNTITENVELSTLWYDVLLEEKKPTGKDTSFYFFHQKKKSVENKAKKVNKALDNLFHSGGTEYLAPSVNKILVKLYPEMKIEFSRRNITVNKWGEIDQRPIINLLVFENGISIDAHNPHFALNEAKLSAIAISIFLGAIIKQSPFSPELKPLFLDDILIGLDNENRLRLLNLLIENDVLEPDKVFKHFQIFITTYDRHWYEVAKINLSDWKFIEFYKSNSGPQVIHNNKTHIEKAQAYFEAYDFPAAANSLRKELERTLKEKLLETYKVDDGLKGLVKPPKLETLIDRIKLYYEDLGINPPHDLISNLQNIKSIALNPMSHDDIESPIYRSDLELAFVSIENLKAINLPVRTTLIPKGEIFEIKLPAISYNAIISLSENVYSVEHEGRTTCSPAKFYFSEWTREGVQYAKPIGSPPQFFSTGELLNKIKGQARTLEEIVTGINQTMIDRGKTEIDVETLIKNISNPSITLDSILAV